MMNTILGKSSPEQPSAKAYYYAWPNRMRVFLGVSTRGMCLWQEPLDCTLALKAGDKGVDLNPSSVPLCAEQGLPTACPWEVVSQISPQTCCTEPSKTRRWLSLLCKVAVPTSPAPPPDQQPACDGWHLFRHSGPFLDACRPRLRTASGPEMTFP